MSLIWLSSASPLFLYSPNPVYFGGSSYTSNWTSITDPAGHAPNNTLITTFGSAAFILPSFYTTSFAPIFTSSKDYVASLSTGTSATSEAWASGQNKSDFSDFSIQTFTITVGCVTGQCIEVPFGFRGAWVGTEYAPKGSVVQSVQLDDASPLVTYTDFSPVGGFNAPAGVAIESTDYNTTLSMITTASASASVTFNGASILVTGVTSPSSGTYTVTLDGSVVATLAARREVVSHGTTLYFATNLDTTIPHTLVLTATAEGGGVGLVIDSWTAYGPQGGVSFVGTINGATTTLTPPAGSVATDSTSPFPTDSTSGGDGITDVTSTGSPNVGTIVGAILGALAGVLLLLWLFRRRLRAKKPDEKKFNPWDEANLLQNMKNEEVHITTVAKQRYVYPGLIAHSELKK